MALYGSEKADAAGFRCSFESVATATPAADGGDHDRDRDGNFVATTSAVGGAASRQPNLTGNRSTVLGTVPPVLGCSARSAWSSPKATVVATGGAAARSSRGWDDGRNAQAAGLPFGGRGVDCEKRDRGEASEKKGEDWRGKEAWVDAVNKGKPRAMHARGYSKKRDERFMVSAIDTEVDAMFDDSKGTLRLAHDALGDERVHFLSLPQLREAYRTGTGTLRSWTTEGMSKTDDAMPQEGTLLMEVEHARMGVLCSTDAYVFVFEQKPSETTPSPSPTATNKKDVLNTAVVPVEGPVRDGLPPRAVEADGGAGPPSCEEDMRRDETAEEVVGRGASNGAQMKEEPEVPLVYLWLGREANARARAAVKTQGERLVKRLPCSSWRSLPLEVEQGCEPTLFLALFSYMQPPLAAVVLQAKDENPVLRVLELHESPCFHGAGIALAVEGDSSLLTKHGPLPGRSYVILVRPCRRRRRRGGGSGGSNGSNGSGGSGGGEPGVNGKGSERGSSSSSGGKSNGGGGVATFDAGYYWHGLEESAAVEGVGILLCQQVERMFPPPSAFDYGRSRRKGQGRRRRVGAGAGGFGMMRGFVADVKLGLPVPDGFWSCIFPGRSSISIGGKPRYGPKDIALLSEELRPAPRTRPVRLFGVCAESQKAGLRYVWEVTAGGMPSQLTLSPSLSHVVDTGTSLVYVWHGAGCHGDGRRLGCRVARAYAKRVEGGATVTQVDAGEEPLLLLNCFIGWDQTLVEPPLMLSYSPPRSAMSGKNPDLLFPDSAAILSEPSPRVDRSRETGSTAGAGPEHFDRRQPRRRSRGSTGNGRARRSPTRRSSTGSGSSASRLTPPRQRTPPLVASPPSLRILPGGVSPPLRGLGEVGIGADDLPRKSGSTSRMLFEIPPWQRQRQQEQPGPDTESSSAPSNGHSGETTSACLESSSSTQEHPTPLAWKSVPSQVPGLLRDYHGVLGCAARPMAEASSLGAIVECAGSTNEENCCDGHMVGDSNPVEVSKGTAGKSCMATLHGCSIAKAYSGKLTSETQEHSGRSRVQEIRCRFESKSQLYLLKCAAQDDGGSNSGGQHSGGGGSNSAAHGNGEDCGGGDKRRGDGGRNDEDAGDSHGCGGDGGGEGAGAGGDDDDDDEKRRAGDTPARRGADGNDDDVDVDSDEDEGTDRFSRPGTAKPFLHGSHEKIGVGSFRGLTPTVNMKTDFSSGGSGSGANRCMFDSRGSMIQLARCAPSAAEFASGNGSSGRGMLDGGDSGERNQSRRLSGFFRSPHSQELLPLKFDRSGATQSVPDVDMLARIFDTTKSFGSDYSDKTNSARLGRSSSSFLDTPQQLVPGHMFDTTRSFGSSDNGKDSSIALTHTSVGVSTLVFDGSPQQQLVPFLRDWPARAVCTGPTLTFQHPAAAPAGENLGVEAGSGVVAASPASVSVQSETSGVDDLPAPDPCLSSAFMDAGLSNLDKTRKDEQAMILQTSETGVQAAGIAAGVAADSQHGACRESEQKWLAAQVERRSADGGNHDAAVSPKTPPALPPRHQEDARVVPTVHDGGEGNSISAERPRWAGLNTDGSWRSEVARIAAGAAGAVEAERRRQAKINEDESWRMDGKNEDHGDLRDVRRQSVSFTRVQDGNVRNKLSVFEHCSGLSGQADGEERTSIGALKGLGLVKARSKNLEPRSPSTFSPALHHASVVEVDDVDKDSDDSASGDEGKGNSDSDSDHESLLSSGSAQLKKKSSKKKKRKEKSKKEFPWKEGPSPPPLPSRPSLGLIRQGQVRIMSKALLMSCPEGVDGEEDSGDTTGKHESKGNQYFSTTSSGTIIPPMPTTPPPLPPVSCPSHLFANAASPSPGPSPPLPKRPSTIPSPSETPQGANGTPGSRGTPSPSISQLGSKIAFWGARVRRKVGGVSPATGSVPQCQQYPASAPVTPATTTGTRSIRSASGLWFEDEGALTPPHMYLGSGAKGDGGAVARAASKIAPRGAEQGLGGAKAAWVKFQRRLGEVDPPSLGVSGTWVRNVEESN